MTIPLIAQNRDNYIAKISSYKKFDRIMNNLPVANTIYNFALIIMKTLYFVLPQILRERDFFDFILDKSNLKCFVLFLPIIGNVTYWSYFGPKEAKAEEQIEDLHDGDVFRKNIQNVSDIGGELTEEKQAREALEAWRKLCNVPPSELMRQHSGFSAYDTMRYNPSEVQNQCRKLQETNNFKLGYFEEDFTNSFTNIKPAQKLINIFPFIINYTPVGRHGYCNSYADNEIMQIYDNPLDGFQEKPHKSCYNEKSILLQGATRGCTAAVAAMLVYDHQETLSDTLRLALKNRNLGNEEDIERDISSCGLSCVISRVPSMERLKKCLEKNGPAIITIDNGCGGHVIIVDEIWIDQVIIRDSIHGWQVGITKNAFRSSSGLCKERIKILQIENQ
ncbi:MAG: hypothetical protein JW769_05310 [Parachlamydiales bacterium]|nr:hypothetical protein [Parachlamydiales bacterium]